MAAVVYYKFKSAKSFDSLPIVGQFISVGCLKRLIFAKHLKKGRDFDIIISDAKSNEEYVDEAALIPKHTSVVIQRVPGVHQAPIVIELEELKVVESKAEELPALVSVSASDSSTRQHPAVSEWDEFVNELSKPVVDVSPASKIEEDKTIKALFETAALDWNCHRQGNYGGGRGSRRGMGVTVMSGRGFGQGGFESKIPPAGYVCHRCRVPGHFIQHCPTNGDPDYDFKRMKPPAGIPWSMLVETPVGSYALPSSGTVVLKPNESKFENEIDCLPSTQQVVDLPPELCCPLCKEVMKDAVFARKCCFRSFCDKCIREYVISKKMCDCGATNVLADDLLPNKTLRDTISRILESAISSSENAGTLGSLPRLQDMESAHHEQSKGPSPTQSAASKNEDQNPLIDHSADVKKNDSRVCEDAKERKVVEDDSRVEDDASDVKGVNDETHHLNKRTTKDTDESEATPVSAGPHEVSSIDSAQMPKETQERFFGCEQVKKKKKKTTQLLESAADLGAEAYAKMPLAPSACYPYWFGGMPVGIDGYVAHFGTGFQYMGYPLGSMNYTFGGVRQEDPFATQHYMMPPVLPREQSRDSRGTGGEMNGRGADGSSAKAKPRSQASSTDRFSRPDLPRKVTNLNHHGQRVTNLNRDDHPPSSHRQMKRRRSSNDQEDEAADRKQKRSVSSRASFPGHSDKDQHRSHRTPDKYYREISYENKTREHAEEEEEEYHFKRRPSWSSSERRDGRESREQGIAMAGTRLCHRRDGRESREQGIATAGTRLCHRRR